VHRILLVDDSLMIHRIVGKIMTDHGFTVIHAENGKKGCEMAKSSMPNLIIMDIEMPEMNGIEATRMIKTDPTISGIPVIVFTTLGSEGDMRKAKEAGADGYVNKPVTRDELLEYIQKFLPGNGAGSGA
jgi:CheY-like chemotaxis protein